MAFGEPSTSSTIDEYHENICSICADTDGDIIRLIFTGQLSMRFIRIVIKNKKITIKHITNVIYVRISHELSFYGAFVRSFQIDESMREFQETFFPDFISHFADYLGTDVNSVQKSIINILSSSNEVIFDFDTQILTSISNKNYEDIQDIIDKLFWYPIRFSKNATRRICSSWFDYVKQTFVIPANSLIYMELFITVKDYLNCIHIIENKKSFIWWHMFQLPDPSQSYLTFLNTAKKKKNAKNNLVLLESNQLNDQYHIVHVFCYSLRDKHTLQYKLSALRNFCNGACSSRMQCLFDHEEVIDSAKNPYIKLQSPIILEKLNSNTSMRIFHIAYEDSIKWDILYALLVQLYVRLKKIKIDKIAIIICSSLDLNMLMKMLNYVFGAEIKVFIFK